MIVNKELLEKYHLGLCSQAEMDAVEQWMLDDNIEKLTLPLDVDKAELKAQMWDEISSILPVEEKIVAIRKTKRIYFSSRAIAASVILLITASSVLWWYHGAIWTKPVFISNRNTTNSQQFTTIPGMVIAIGPESNANIVTSDFHNTASIDFCGTILIDPDKDVELTFNTHCAEANPVQEKRMFRKGQTYIAINYEFENRNELLVVNARDMMQLPTLLRKQLITQFKI